MDRKRRILMIDDSPQDFELIMQSLDDARLPAEWKRVSNTNDLISELASWSPDIILADFHVPPLSAIEVLTLLRERQVDVPVIVVTGTLNDDLAAQCLNHGAVDYVLKDRLVRLPSAIERALGEKQFQSERARALADLRESELRFRQVTESIDEVFWLTDIAHTGVIYVSPAYERIWGRPCESLYDVSRSWMDAIHVEDRDKMEKAVLQLKTSGGYDLEYRIVRPDGEVRWIRDRAFPVEDTDGKTYRIAGVAEDITQRRELEDQLRQAQKMDAIGQLAGGIAHDFNNLLTVIAGYSQLTLARLLPEDPLRRSIDQINRAAFRASSLTRQLLTFSRKQVVQPRILSLNNVVSNIEGMLSRLIHEDVQLKTILDPDLAPVRADSGQMEQIIFNLVVNARDAMPHGGVVTLETRNVELEPQRDSQLSGWHVLLAVSDTGVGMSQNVLSHMFEPFFTTKAPGKGTGLGLATVYGIVKQSEGSILVSSEIGRGTTFNIYLPRTEGTVTDDESPGAVSYRPGSETILLVEDDDMVRELTREILRRSGYTVLEARDVHEALRIGKQNEHIDLLLTDVVMPHASGQQLSERIVASKPDVKVLYMSGHSDAALHHRGMIDSDINFITKPFAPEALLKKIREIFDNDAPSKTTRKLTILLVETDPLLSASSAESLREKGYRVITASDGVEAWRCMRLVYCDLLITDIALPYKDGIDLSIEVRKDYPVTKLIGTSTSVETLAKRSVARHFDAVLAKPFTNEQLLATVRQQLGIQT
jgi:two-component system cell cycle sensor histidine kinase/response regulator CckA